MHALLHNIKLEKFERYKPITLITSKKDIHLNSINQSIEELLRSGNSGVGKRSSATSPSISMEDGASEASEIRAFFCEFPKNAVSVNCDDRFALGCQNKFEQAQ